jgi:cell division protein FtsW
LIAGGAKLRHLAFVAACIAVVVLLVALFQPYVRDRMFGFIHPAADAAGTGFQAAQAKIALGSGGLFGVGLGQGVQKAFYLPEAHTDMIAAVIGEELGLMGITVLVGLFSMYGYAGLRTAQRARNRYEKLLAAGLTSLVLGQAAVNLFAVMGLAPVTGVPLPFVSYGNSSLLVMLAATGLILNIARRQPARARTGPKARVRRRRAAPAFGRRRARVFGQPALEGARTTAAASSVGPVGAAAARLQVLEGGRSDRRSGGERSRGKSRHSRGRHGRARRAGDRSR